MAKVKIGVIGGSGLYNMPGLDQQAGQPQAHAIARVPGNSSLPKRFGDDSKHLPTVKQEGSIRERVKFKPAKFHDSSTNSMSTPAVLEG